MMLSHVYLALPRRGHLDQLFICLHICLKKHHNLEIVFDPSDPVVDEFEAKDWTTSEFGDIQGKEELPPNASPPCGFGFTITVKVDADHAADTVTCRL